MFEHEINGMDADKDEPVSLDHKLFDEDFLIEKPKRPILRPSHTVEIPGKNNMPANQNTPRGITQQPVSGSSRSSRKTNSPCMMSKKKHNSEV